MVINKPNQSKKLLQKLDKSQEQEQIIQQAERPVDQQIIQENSPDPFDVFNSETDQNDFSEGLSGIEVDKRPHTIQINNNEKIFNQREPVEIQFIEQIVYKEKEDSDVILDKIRKLD